MPAAELDEARRARAAEKTRRNRARKPEVYGQHQHKANLKRRYGISPEMYAEMLERQEGVCAICGGVNKFGREGCADEHFIAHRINVKTEVWLESGGVYRPVLIQPAAAQTIDRIVKRCAQSAGVRNPRQVTSHMFRRALLERLLEQGVSPYVVAALAGHADIKTTAGYGGGASLQAVRGALLSDGTLTTPAKADTEKEGFEPSLSTNPDILQAGLEHPVPLVTGDLLQDMLDILTEGDG